MWLVFTVLDTSFKESFKNKIVNQNANNIGDGKDIHLDSLRIV